MVSCSSILRLERSSIFFHEHNAYEKIPDLLERLKSVFLCLGLMRMPFISDPGHDLVSKLHRGYSRWSEHQLVLQPLIASGLATQPHILWLPTLQKTADWFFKENVLSLRHRFLRVTLLCGVLLKIWWGLWQPSSNFRELTKLYEEYQRGSISEVFRLYCCNPLKGEYLLIVWSLKWYEENLTSNVTPVEVAEALIAWNET